MIGTLEGGLSESSDGIGEERAMTPRRQEVTELVAAERHVHAHTCAPAKWEPQRERADKKIRGKFDPSPPQSELFLPRTSGFPVFVGGKYFLSVSGGAPAPRQPYLLLARQLAAIPSRAVQLSAPSRQSSVFSTNTSITPPPLAVLG